MHPYPDSLNLYVGDLGIRQVRQRQCVRRFILTRSVLALNPKWIPVELLIGISKRCETQSQDCHHTHLVTYTTVSAEVT